MFRMELFDPTFAIVPVLLKMPIFKAFKIKSEQSNQVKTCYAHSNS